MSNELLSSMEKETNGLENKEKKKGKGFMRETIEAVAIALVLAVIIRTFLFNFFWIPSRSMVPTLLVNDRIIVTKFSYWLNEPQRGDVVVFEYPLNEQEGTDMDYVKRLIGLPGETIELKNSQLYVNGELVPEPYLPEGLEFADYGPIVVPEGQYFMLGDNRNNSSDSRVWGFVDEELIIGKGQMIYWPFNRMASLRN